MDFDKYKNKMEYPTHPKKLILGKNASPAEVRAYADELEKYEIEEKKYEKLRSAYNKHGSELNQKFREDALEDVGLTGHPKADKAFAFAYEHGHSSGISEVYGWLVDVAELILD